MEKLSLKKHGWKCVLGAEVVYVICLLGGFFLPLRSVRGIELHHTDFESLPAFTGLVSEVSRSGAIYMFVFAWIFAWYFVWMHNSSFDF